MAQTIFLSKKSPIQAGPLSKFKPHLCRPNSLPQSQETQVGFGASSLYRGKSKQQNPGNSIPENNPTDTKMTYFHPR